eukprot:Skav234818  [mRNA]  locus=scaffold69:839003:840506:+ [translate_table: standard]
MRVLPTLKNQTNALSERQALQLSATTTAATPTPTTTATTPTSTAAGSVATISIAMDGRKVRLMANEATVTSVTPIDIAGTVPQKGIIIASAI